MVKKSRGSDYSVEEGTPIDFTRRIKRSDPALDEQLKSLRHSNTIEELEEIDNLHEIGLDFLNRKELQSALKKFDRILEINPYDIDALAHKGEILFKTFKPMDALRAFQKILTIQPDNVDGHMLMANMLGRGRKHREAIKYYDKVLELEPDNAVALLNKSYELIKLGLNLEALEVVRKIKAKSRDLIVDACFNQGEALFKLKKFKESLETFNMILALNPKDDEAWYMKGQCLSQLNRRSEADKALLVARSINPKQRRILPKLI